VARIQASVRGLTLTAVLLLILAAGGWLWYDQNRLHEADTAARESLAVAPAAAAAIFSYDYRTFDDSVASGRSFTTGTFTDEYAKTTASLKEAAITEQAVVTAQTSVGGVIEASPDRVDVLLYINQYRRNTNITGEKVDQNRVVLTLVKVDGSWKVSGAAAI
jgi:Mce-associated membrane protein